MPRKSPGAKARGLGAELRLLRNSAGVTLKSASTSLGLSTQAVSRLETGKRNISVDEVAGLLALYGVTGLRREQLLTMARALDEPGWWELSMPGVTRESALLADYEEHATRITSWAPLLIPGLLQTMDYSRSFMLEDGLERAQVEARLTARLRRQARLDRPDVEYLALIGESALPGADDIQVAQLDALLRAADRANVTVRVVPTDVIPRQARLGAFILLESPVVVHVELARSGAFLDEPSFTDPYLALLGRVEKVALDERESVRCISTHRYRMDHS